MKSDHTLIKYNFFLIETNILKIETEFQNDLRKHQFRKHDNKIDNLFCQYKYSIYPVKNVGILNNLDSTCKTFDARLAFLLFMFYFFPAGQRLLSQSAKNVTLRSEDQQKHLHLNFAFCGCKLFFGHRVKKVANHFTVGVRFRFNTNGMQMRS